MERFCINRSCYYHGEAEVCPECGKQTKPVIEADYDAYKAGKRLTDKVYHDVYTLREIGG